MAKSAGGWNKKQKNKMNSMSHCLFEGGKCQDFEVRKWHYHFSQCNNETVKICTGSPSINNVSALVSSHLPWYEDTYHKRGHAYHEKEREGGRQRETHLPQREERERDRQAHTHTTKGRHPLTTKGRERQAGTYTYHKRKTPTYHRRKRERDRQRKGVATGVKLV